MHERRGEARSGDVRRGEARRGEERRGEARMGEDGRGRWRRLASIRAALLRIFGMPDYQTYVRHLTACHPGRAVPSERQFFEEYLKARYEGGPTRCC
jgi:uncharacterized short protein YbdD (DUF466 family)